MDAAYSAYREIRIEENRKRRLRIVRRQRIILGLAIALVVFSFAFLCSKLVLSAHSENGRFKYYTTITVSSSDSLTDIAENFMTGEYTNIDEYINEICQINHIYDANSIRIGDQLIIPYYSSDFKQ